MVLYDLLKIGRIRQHKFHYGVVIIIVLLAGFGLHRALYYGLANIAHIGVLNAVAKWQTSPTEHSYQEFSQIKAKAQQAVLYQPGYAEYWSVLAQVYEWGFIFGYTDTPNALQDAKQYYLRATQLRPLWPDTWASLIKLKWRLQEFDSELLFYVNQASTFGPQKPDIHLVIVELGLALNASHHPLLDDIRAEFYRRLALGLKHPASNKRVLELLSQYQAKPLACEWLKNADQKIRKNILKCR